MCTKHNDRKDRGRGEGNQLQEADGANYLSVFMGCNATGSEGN